MSRTYRKNIRQNIATGSNHEYYKIRRRNARHSSNNILKNLIANYNVEEVSDVILNPKMPKKDTWREPTDGYILVNKDTLCNLDDYYKNKYEHILKNKK